jgi:hypothetical protein
VPRHIARWDLDKTYLRTDFDTLRDLLRTALERPDEKTTNPGAATLLREMVRAGISVHILSGSPEQMRRRLEDKLRLDGIQWDSFTLKPNLQNLLRLRLRAVKDQLGFKLPALLQARLSSTPLGPGESGVRHETLFGDDAEADAFVYSLYADVLAGRVAEDVLIDVCERGRVYPDVAETILEYARHLEHVNAVERILIHLESQTAPDHFRVYGLRAVPFYNYLQAALIVHEDGRLGAEAVLRVGVELVVHHRFDGDALARSYLNLARRGHLRGSGAESLAETFEQWATTERMPGYVELRTLIERLPSLAEKAKALYRDEPSGVPDYARLVREHNPRRSRQAR